MSGKCDMCGEYAAEGATSCGECGRALAECSMCRAFAERGFACCGVCGRPITKCPKCESFVAQGSAFCGGCGRPVAECTRCDYYEKEGAAFCGGCGRALKDPNAGLGPAGVIFILLSAFVLFVLIFELFTLVINSPDTVAFLENTGRYYFVIMPFPERIFDIDGVALQLFWVAEIIIILACAAYAIMKFVKALTPSKGGLTKDSVENTAVFWVSVFLSASMAIGFTVSLILILTGNEPTVPDFGDTVEQMYGMADAAVWEEIVARLLLIGVPMMIVSLIATKKKESLLCIFGGFGMSGAAFVFIIVSGVIFGLAHYPGWDDQLWKVLTTAIMGVFLGYVFVRFGLYAAILLHFINNYLSAFNWMGADALLIWIFLMLVIAGFGALAYIIYRMATSKETIKSLPAFRNNFVKSR